MLLFGVGTSIEEKSKQESIRKMQARGTQGSGYEKQT